MTSDHPLSSAALMLGEPYLKNTNQNQSWSQSWLDFQTLGGLSVEMSQVLRGVMPKVMRAEAMAKTKMA